MGGTSAIGSGWRLLAGLIVFVLSGLGPCRLFGGYGLSLGSPLSISALCVCVLCVLCVYCVLFVFRGSQLVWV